MERDDMVDSRMLAEYAGEVGCKVFLTCEEPVIDVSSSEASRKHCSRPVSNVSALY